MENGKFKLQIEQNEDEFLFGHLVLYHENRVQIWHSDLEATNGSKAVIDVNNIATICMLKL